MEQEDNLKSSECKKTTEGVVCPFCGSLMGWESDAMSEECGYEKEDHIVSFYTCKNYGTIAEFVEGYDKED